MGRGPQPERAGGPRGRWRAAPRDQKRPCTARASGHRRTCQRVLWPEATRVGADLRGRDALEEGRGDARGGGGGGGSVGGAQG
eukprot:2813224-Rhodomonas_salina.3